MTDLRARVEGTIPASGTCKKPGCGRPKVRPRHRCLAHDEKQRLAPAERAQAALERRAALPVGWKHTRGSGACSGCGLPDLPDDYRVGAQCGGCSVAGRRERTWKLTPKQQIALHQLSEGKCQGCGNHQRIKATAVDHNHQTDEVRGYLCQTCNNVIIGSAFENPAILLALVVYLIAPPARKVLSPETALSKQETIAEIVKMLEDML